MRGALLLFVVALLALGGAGEARASSRYAPVAAHAGGSADSAAGWRPNDPFYSGQDYLRVIGLEQAWTTQRGSPSVIVAVVDSGVDVNQPDLQGAIWQDDGKHALPPNCGVNGCNELDPAHTDTSCDNVSFSPGDVQPTYPHGTFVAGIIAARADNGIGIAGVAPTVTILPIRAGDCHGVYIPAEAQGIEDAVALGATVINLSIGQEDCAAPPAELVRAIDDAEAAGVLVVAAAGNSDRNCLSAPANAPNVIAVVASSADGQRKAAFSDWNDPTADAPVVVLAAPGVGIEGALPVGDGSTALYASEDGTSFAAPIVSGVAALLLSQNPWLSPAQLRQILAASAQPLATAGIPGWSGSGLVRADQALQQVPQGLSGLVTFDGQPPPDGTEIAATINGVPCGSTQTYAARDGGEGYVLLVQPATVQPGCGQAGATVTISIAGRPAGQARWSPTVASLALQATDR